MRYSGLLAVVCGLVLFSGTALGEEPITMWDVAGDGLFDKTNKAYAIEHGLVTVDIHKTEDGQVIVDTPGCPTGLGHLASGRENVKQIRFVFQHKQAGDYWLHVAWNPGGSGKEQFEVSCNGRRIAESGVIDGKEDPYRQTHERFRPRLRVGENTITLRQLSGDGLRFSDIVLCRSHLRRGLKFETLASYEAGIEEPGVLLDSPHVRLFAPKRKAVQAKIIFGYLVKAYEELRELVGRETEEKIRVYHFPESTFYGYGGTSNYKLWYGYKRLDLESDEEWKRHKVPHVSGYIEEMAHNFVHATRAQFGWEMVGWSISAKVSQKVAGNPILRKHIEHTRQKQAQTFKRYRRLGNTWPADIRPNLCDRIHAYILWMCEKRYGPSFWRDVFAEIAKERGRLIAAGRAEGTYDERRNKRYQITLECFDRVMRRKNIDFKKQLQTFGISLTEDVKSLHPTKTGWNRKFH